MRRIAKFRISAYAFDACLEHAETLLGTLSNIVIVVISPEVVPLTEDEVGFGEEGGSHFSQPASAAGAFEAILVPVLVHGFQQESLIDYFVASITNLWCR